ncbi:hypothetical protein [Ammoniphilus sp. 3BR4]
MLPNHKNNPCDPYRKKRHDRKYTVLKKNQLGWIPNDDAKPRDQEA